MIEQFGFKVLEFGPDASGFVFGIYLIRAFVAESFEQTAVLSIAQYFRLELLQIK